MQAQSLPAGLEPLPSNSVAAASSAGAVAAPAHPDAPANNTPTNVSAAAVHISPGIGIMQGTSSPPPPRALHVNRTPVLQAQMQPQAADSSPLLALETILSPPNMSRVPQRPLSSQPTAEQPLSPAQLQVSPPSLHVPPSPSKGSPGSDTLSPSPVVVTLAPSLLSPTGISPSAARSPTSAPPASSAASAAATSTSPRITSVQRATTTRVQALPLRPPPAAPLPARFAFPTFRPDGDVDQRYANQQHVLRKRAASKLLLLFALLYVLLEIPYIVHSQWDARLHWPPLLIRLLVAGVIVGAVWLNARVYVALKFTQTPARFEALCCALMSIAAVMLSVAETERQPAPSTLLRSIDPSTGIPFLSSVKQQLDPVMEDGLLLALCCLYAFAAGVLKLRVGFCAVLGGASMIAYTVAILEHRHHTERFLLLSLAYQLLMIMSLLYMAHRTEALRLRALEHQKMQFLERKKAEKLLRSMLPARILSDYLDGNIGQVQAVATVGFVQMHLGAIASAAATAAVAASSLHPPGTPSHGSVSPSPLSSAAGGGSSFSSSSPSTPSPGELMQKLHDTFKRVDGIVAVYAVRGVQKIETVATTYLLCAGLLEPVDDHASAMIDVSLEICSMVNSRLHVQTGVGGANPSTPGTSRAGVGRQRIPVLLRIGISSGPVVGGIIGAQRRFFRIFGDTVNVAARMCTTVGWGSIQISPSAHACLSERQRAAYVIPPPTLKDIKGKGQMECYKIESRADWVAKFNKSVMSRGQMDRDEPLLNKSFVYHKLVQRTDLKKFTLQFCQHEGASATTSSFVSRSPPQTQNRMQRLGSVGKQGFGLQLAVVASSSSSSNVETQPSAAPLVLPPASDPPLGNAAAARQTAKQPSSGFFNRLRSSSAAADASAPSASASGPSAPSPADLRARLQRTHMLGSTSLLHAALESAPFGAPSIERFFQLKYAKQFLREVRWANLIYLAFQLATLAYVLLNHERRGSGEWDAHSERSVGPTIMAALLVLLFGAFDIASIMQRLWRKGVCRSCCGDRRNRRAAVADDSDVPVSSSSGSGNSSSSHGFSPAGPSGGGVNSSDLAPPTPFTPDARFIDHFARHLQSYSLLFASLLLVWVLVALGQWGVNSGTEIHPVFAMLALIVYASCSLRLQFRFLAPLLSGGLVAFLVILLAQRMNGVLIWLLFSHLLCALGIGLRVLYTFERAARSNFLLAYALEKEALFMDDILQNLLPKDVVALLKKQNPALARQVVHAASASVMQAHHGVAVAGSPMSNRGSRGGTSGLGDAGSAGPSTPAPTPRAGGGGSFGGAGGGMMTLNSPSSSGVGGGSVGGGIVGSGGGIASRFAMHFPQTTVFESDIVGYTQMVSSLSASDTLNLLNLLFSRFDAVAHALGVEKIETIGDAFMCMVFEGLPDPVLDFALAIVPTLRQASEETRPKQELQIRMGIATGSCYGGIVGTDVPRFHLFGQAHDVSIHIEQNGRAGDIIVSRPTWALSRARYEYEQLDLVVDEIDTFLLKGKRMEGEQVEHEQQGGGENGTSATAASHQQPLHTKRPHPRASPSQSSVAATPTTTTVTLQRRPESVHLHNHASTSTPFSPVAARRLDLATEEGDEVASPAAERDDPAHFRVRVDAEDDVLNAVPYTGVLAPAASPLHPTRPAPLQQPVGSLELSTMVRAEGKGSNSSNNSSVVPPRSGRSSGGSGGSDSAGKLLPTPVLLEESSPTTTHLVVSHEHFRDPAAAAE